MHVWLNCYFPTHTRMTKSKENNNIQQVVKLSYDEKQFIRKRINSRKVKRTIPSSKRMLTAARNFTRSSQERVFRTHFGVPSLAVEKLFITCIETCSKIHPPTPLAKSWGIDNLFQCLNFLCVPPSSWTVAAQRWNTAIDTFKKYLMFSLEILNKSLPKSQGICQ
jgi:hypothetical protein